MIRDQRMSREDSYITLFSIDGRSAERGQHECAHNAMFTQKLACADACIRCVSSPRGEMDVPAISTCH